MMPANLRLSKWQPELKDLKNLTLKVLNHCICQSKLNRDKALCFYSSP